MGKYRTDNGIVDTDNAVTKFDMDMWDGHNYVCGGVGHHQEIMQTPKGQWYILHTSQWEGCANSVKLLTEKEAYERLCEMFLREKYEKNFSSEFLKKQEDNEL